MGYGTTISTVLDFDETVEKTPAALVQALDPQVMVSLPDGPGLQPVADEADSRLRAALEAVQG